MFEWVHYQFPSRIFYEHEATPRIGTIVKDIGSRVLLVTNRDELADASQLDVVKDSLNKHTAGCILYDDIVGLPDYAELDTAAHFAKQSNADTIMAFGGRNAINTARVIALLSTNEVFAQDLPRAQLPLQYDPLPVITVPVGPTLGEEAVPSFYIYDSETRNSFQSYDVRLYPSLIFIDPALSAAVNAHDYVRNTFATLAANVESILSKKSNDITSSLAIRSIELIYRSISSYNLDQSNKNNLMNIALASSLAGMSHASSSLGLCYAVGMAANTLLHVNLETVMSIVLPHVMEYNLTGAASKYVSIARALEEDTADISVIEAAIKSVEGTKKIIKKLKLPERLSEFEIKKADLPKIALQATQNPLLINAPRNLDRSEVEAILIASF